MHTQPNQPAPGATSESGLVNVQQPTQDNIDTWLWTMINTMNACRIENLEKDKRYDQLCHYNRILYAKVSALETKHRELLLALETALLTQNKILHINQTLEAELQKTRSESNAMWASQQGKTDASSCRLQHHKGQVQSERRNNQNELDSQLLEEEKQDFLRNSSNATGHKSESPDEKKVSLPDFASNTRNLRSRNIPRQC